MKSGLLPAALALLAAPWANAQLGRTVQAFTRADTLRGSIGPERAWWNALHYDVQVTLDIDARAIKGRTVISFEAVAPGQRMQLDLQQPLVVDSITTEVAVAERGGIEVRHRPIPFERDGHVVWVDLPQPMRTGEAATLTVHYGGRPRTARTPPWDGGWIWTNDARGNPWATVACQGLGASVWYPCKDHQSDEPDHGASLHVRVPDSLVAVGNGRLAGTTVHGDGTTTWTWSVLAPINTYNLVPYVGKYVRFGEDFDGAEGRLDVDYWVLAHNEQRAREQFRQVPGMLRCFEHWLGPFPFRSDGYKLVESPHLGMEHQSAIAYGNRYQNGYLGSDLSGTGHGLKWDYILVHESGHEWFGNSITTADIADMWVHEGFTQYTEVLHTECLLGREAAEEYLVGLRRGIRNDRPIIGPYGVNHEGSGDMYPKGANVVHMVRHILNDDEAFRAMLRGMNAKYRHSVVSSAEIEAFMDGHTPADLRPLFDQYLRSNRVPELEWGVHKGRLWLRWVNCNAGFTMPVRLRVDGRDLGLITPTTEWHGSRNTYGRRSVLEADRNWYVRTRQVGKAQLKGLRATANGNPPTAF